jgi:hypothetical protein
LTLSAAVRRPAVGIVVVLVVALASPLMTRAAVSPLAADLGSGAAVSSAPSLVDNGPGDHQQARSFPKLHLVPAGDDPQWFAGDWSGDGSGEWTMDWAVVPPGVSSRDFSSARSQFTLLSLRDDPGADEAVTIPLPAYSALGVMGLGAGLCYGGARWLKLRK